MNKLLALTLTALTTFAAVPTMAHAQKAREDSVSALRTRIDRLRGQMTEHEYDDFAATQQQIEVARDLALSDGTVTPAESQAITEATRQQESRLRAFVQDFNARSARRIRQ